MTENNIFRIRPRKNDSCVIRQKFGRHTYRHSFRNFKAELLRQIEELVTRKQGEASRWLNSRQVRRLLNISHGTLQNLRNNATIPYVKIGGVIRYDREDIDRIMLASKRTKRIYPDQKKTRT